MLSRTFVSRTSLKFMSKSATARAGAIARHMASGADNSDEQESPVLFESEGGMRTYVLNRAKKLNAVDTTMLNLLRPKIEDWNKSEECKLIVGRAVGRAFCAGGDVVGVANAAQDPSTRAEAIDFFKREFELNYVLAKLRKPYVVIMDGITMGGGLGLSFPAPFRIATERTNVAMPETKIGYAPDVGASYYLPRMDGSLGTWMGLTGESVKGEDVYTLGIATHFVHSSKIPSLLKALSTISIVSDATPDAISATIDSFAPPSPVFVEHAQLDTPSPFTGPLRGTLDAAFARPSVPKIVTALTDLASPSSPRPSASPTSNSEPASRATVGAPESTADAAPSSTYSTATFSSPSGDGHAAGKAPKADASAKWVQATLDTLHARSPTSLKVTLEEIRRTREGDLGIGAALQMEVGMAAAFCSGATRDFRTGVYAVIVDRIKARPAWDPPTLADVPDGTITKNFFDRTRSKYIPQDLRLDIGTGVGEKVEEEEERDPMRWGLPRENDIMALVTGDARGSGALSLTREQALEAAEGLWGAKYGWRTRVEEVLDRKCDVVDNGNDGERVWLKWRH